MNRRLIGIGDRVAAAIVALALAAGVVACGKDEIDESTPIAEVGDEVLTEGELRRMVGAGEDGRATAEDRRAVAERWVSRELLYREAMRREIDEKPEVAAQVRAATRDILVDALLEQAFGARIAVADGEITRYYDTHRALFRRPETTVHVKQIIVDTQGDADRIYAHLSRAPSEFDDVARVASTDQASGAGGDVGFLSAATANSPELWQAVASLPINAVSRPVRTELGWHIFLVLDRRPAGGTMPLDEVRLEVANRVRTAKRAQLTAELIDQLRAKGRFTLYQDRLGPRTAAAIRPTVPDTGSILEKVEQDE